MVKMVPVPAVLESQLLGFTSLAYKTIFAADCLGLESKSGEAVWETDSLQATPPWSL